MPFQKGNKTWSRKYFWDEAMLQFLRENYSVLKHRELCAVLKMPRTTVKNKAMQLGLRKIKKRLQWTEEQEYFLSTIYESLSNGELVNAMKEKWPDENFTVSTITGKLRRANLFRSEEMRKQLMGTFCPAKTLDDRWVARCIAGSKMHLYPHILNNPELIELKKQQLILNRIIQSNDTNTKAAVL